MICIECEHECHCGDKCPGLPEEGGCGCAICIHPMTWWKKIINYLT